jgi:hypothetical protein
LLLDLFIEFFLIVVCPVAIDILELNTEAYCPLPIVIYYCVFKLFLLFTNVRGGFIMDEWVDVIGIALDVFTVVSVSPCRAVVMLGFLV